VKSVVRILVVLIIVAFIVVAGVLLVRRKKRVLAAAPRYGTRPVPVHVATAVRGTLRKTRDYLAVVEPFRTARISARVTGAIDNVLHDENEWVKAGEMLIILDSREVEQALAAAKAQVEQARAQLASNLATVGALEKTADYWRREAQRDQELAAKGAIPASQAEGTADKASEAEGKLEAARQMVTAIRHQIEGFERKQAELETMLDYCTIRSPFAGVISSRVVDPGDLAVPGKHLMTVEDRSRLKLAFDVPQQDLPDVRQGLPLEYLAGGVKRKATLSHMFPSLNAARMVRAEVFLDGTDWEGLSSGAYVPLTVVVEEGREAVLIPAGSVVESPDRKPHVFVATDGHLEARPVEVVGYEGDDVAIQGVDAGEQVVVSTFLGWARLSSGLTVETMQ